MSIFVGTAGWSIPRHIADRFPAEGTGLERYASAFRAAEINSSFHRSHRRSTWERWRDSVPGDFRFSVKLPRIITHAAKLTGCTAEVERFIEETSLLGDKLAVLLVQLPPKLAFDAAVAEDFFGTLNGLSSAALACEPRHPAWFRDEADALLAEHRVARVAADPAICEAAAVPGGWKGLAYWRLHGSPVVYRSAYGNRVKHYADQVRTEAEKGGDAWCIFDNTASSAGAADALALAEVLHSSP